MVTMLFTLAAVFIFMSLLFLIAVKMKNNAIVDLGWGMGFILIGWLELILSGTSAMRQWITLLLVTVWGMRLSIHIYLRNRGKGEDYRYRNLREKWGKRILIKSYLFIFLFQGLLMIFIAFPVILIQRFPEKEFNGLDGFGILVWLTGFVIETMADAQLRRFILHEKNEKNPFCMKGLWKLSRHPNYFGEAMLWWGIWILSLSTPYGMWAIISPILVGWLLQKVSGIPLLEKKYANHPVYIAYARKTNRFVPWIPKKSPSL